MNEMMVSTIYADGAWFTVEGEGYRKTGAHHVGRRRAGAGLHPAGARARARQRRDRRATTAPWSATRPRRRSSCSRPSSASTPRRPAGPTRASPRCRSTPTTSSWRPSTACPVDGRRARGPAGQGRPRRRARALHPRRRPDERRAGADRGGSRRASTPPTSGWARRACACSRSPRGSSTTTSSTR